MPNLGSRKKARSKKPAESNRLIPQMIRLDSARAQTKSAGLSLPVKGRQPVTMAGGSEIAVPAGRGFVPSALGRLGHQSAGIMTGTRGARCNRGRRRRETPAI